uniref:Alpha/beta hydrolase fold-3 domain-containing protein n=1 Tax=Bionectria ochroleuca TaxID=29856 RepID=A0A8H7KD97_BIOOC
MAGPQEHPTVSRQPLNALFHLLYAVTIIVRLPFWLIVALLARQNPKWSVKQALSRPIAKAIIDLEARIGITEKISLEPGREGDRFQVIQPHSSDLYKGPLSSSNVSPDAVGVTWFPQAPGKDIISKTVALYIHGGGFVMHNGRNKECSHACKTLIGNGDTGIDAVVSLQYRLSGYAGQFPFPAAFQDCLTAYLYLINILGVPAQQVVLCGDSAGGNLIISLLRYIQEFSDLGIPTPKCAALFSPWVSPLDYDMSKNPRDNTDYVPSSFLEWGVVTYTAGLSAVSSNPYIIPAGHAFATPVPFFVNTGTSEIFLDDVRKWVDEMQAVAGNHIELHLEDSGVHDTFLAGTLIGFEKSAQDAIDQMGCFVRKF